VASLRDLYKQYGQPVKQAFKQSLGDTGQFAKAIVAAPIQSIANTARSVGTLGLGAANAFRDNTSYLQGIQKANQQIPEAQFGTRALTGLANRGVISPKVVKPVQMGSDIASGFLIPGGVGNIAKLDEAAPLVRLAGYTGLRAGEGAAFGGLQGLSTGDINAAKKGARYGAILGGVGNIVTSPRLTAAAGRDLATGAVNYGRNVADQGKIGEILPKLYAPVENLTNREAAGKFATARDAGNYTRTYSESTFNKALRSKEGLAGTVDASYSPAEAKVKVVFDKNGEVKSIVPDRPEFATYLENAANRQPVKPPTGQVSKYESLRAKNNPELTAEELQAGMTSPATQFRTRPTDQAPSGEPLGVSRSGETQPQTPRENQVVSENSSLPQTVAENVKQRKLLNTISGSDKATPQLQEGISQIDPQTYTQRNTKELYQGAEATVKQDYAGSLKQVMENKGALTDQDAALGDLLIEKAAKENRLDDALALVEHLDQRARESGRGIQALSYWGKLSPQGIVKAADKAAEQAGRTLPKEFRQSLIERMTEIRAMPEGESKLAATQQVLKDIAQQLPASKAELFDAYRYQNMLAGPRTQERNIYQNLFQTLITRPLDLTLHATTDAARSLVNPIGREVHFSDVPQYYKEVFAGVPDALLAAKEAFKNLGTSAKLDNVKQAGNAIQAFREANRPAALTLIPRFLEAQDKFFQALIGAGEKSRLLASGKTEAEAVAGAQKVAEHYLLRNKLGSTKDDALVVQALDSIGQLALKGRSLPAIGKPWGWFVPFVTTPVNAAKVMVEHSPLGIVGGKVNSEKVAKALGGTIVLSYGAMLASQDRVTWAAPTDQKAKDLFYASGRKPFSVEIGGKWVPLTYFGPYALSMAIPAAIKQEFSNDPKAGTEDFFTKSSQVVADTAQFLSSQTSLQSVGGFLRLLDGDTSVTLGSLAGFTGSQAIPLDGLVRYISGIIDPVFRKGSGFRASIIKDLPWASKTLPAYTDPLGRPSTRNTSDYLAPYSTGTPNNQFEGLYQGRQSTLRANAIVNAGNKNGGTGAVAGGSEVASGIYQLPDGRFTAQIGNELKVFANQDKAKEAQAIDQVSSGQTDRVRIGDKVVVSDPTSASGVRVIDVKKETAKAQDSQLTYDIQQAKDDEDYGTWEELQKQRLGQLQQDLQGYDPELDASAIIAAKSQVRSIVKQISKYRGYGGAFKKPSSGRSSAERKFLAEQGARFSLTSDKLKRTKDFNGYTNLLQQRIGQLGAAAATATSTTEQLSLLNSQADLQDQLQKLVNQGGFSKIKKPGSVSKPSFRSVQRPQISLPSAPNLSGGNVGFGTIGNGRF